MKELYNRARYATLRSECVEASYFLDNGTLPQLVANLRTEHDVLGVVACDPQALDVAAELMEPLKLSWNDPAVLRRLRCRDGLKQYLRNHHPKIALTESRLVRHTEDVYQRPLPERFVIQPNFGTGLGDGQAFRSATPRAEIAAYFAVNRGPCVLVEQLFGPRYHIRGQMDATGTAHVLQVTERVEVAANGRSDVLQAMHHVPRADAAFAPLAAYATEVMQALGLRRSPFDVSVTLTVHGPRLLDVTAGLGRIADVQSVQAAHGTGFDGLGLAAHHYLFDAPFIGPGPNWEHYDRIRLVNLFGVATRAERIYRLEGLQLVEAMPEFLRWLQRPQLGAAVARTVDSDSAAYAVQLRTYDAEQGLDRAAEQVRRGVLINRQVSGARRLRVALWAGWRSWRWRGQFLLARALGI